MKLKIYPTRGNVAANLEIRDEIFKVSEKPAVLSQTVRAQLANRRHQVAHSKDRGEVSGGGRKPFRQKGTGNARAGSNRSPVWKGGGVVFGPQKNRNFSKRLPRRVANLALRMALSEKVKNNRLIVVSVLELAEPKTALIQAFLEKLPIEEGRILISVSKTNVNLELASANLKFIKVVPTSGVNLLDVLKSDYLVTDKAGVQALEKALGGEA